MSANGQNRLKKENLPTAAAPDTRGFGRARAHSRRVRLLKTALPAAALLAAGVFSWFTFFAAPSGKAVISLNNDSGQHNKLVMTAPKVEGYTKDNRPYSVKAARAIQDPAKTGIIELQNISGSVPLGARGNADIQAAGAFFDNVNGLLHFDKPFTVRTADGISARFASAEVNMQSGLMNSSEPLEIKSAARRLYAASMRMSDGEKGRIIYFGGRVHILINEGGKPAAGGGAPPAP